MRDWLLRDLQALAARPSERVSAQKPHNSPPSIAQIMASTANNMQRCGRLGTAVMHLPASMDTSSVIAHLKSLGVTDEDATSGRVVSALAVSCSPLSARRDCVVRRHFSHKNSLRSEHVHVPVPARASPMPSASCSSCGLPAPAPPPAHVPVCSAYARPLMLPSFFKACRSMAPALRPT